MIVWTKVTLLSMIFDYEYAVRARTILVAR